MTKLYAVTDTVEDIFTGSSTTIVGVFSTIDKATAAVIAHREKTISKAKAKGSSKEEIEELDGELNRCVEITETILDAEEPA